MKKLLAITLAFVLVLSLGVAAYAAGSPTKTVTTDDLPAQSAAVSEAFVAAPAAPAAASEEDVEVPEESDAVKEAEVVTGSAAVVSIKDMTAAQKTETNKALKAVVEEGALPVDAFVVDTEGAATVAIALDENEIGNIVIYVFFPDGKVVKLPAKDLVVREDGTYEIPVEDFSYVVIAKEA